MQRIKPQKLSDVIMQRLESMILEGELLAGQKLPPERELAEKFAVSRPSLREAIQKLETKGLIYRKQGGGTFVQTQLAPLVTDPLLNLISTHPESQFDLLEFRHALEGMAAYYAALRGKEDDFRQIEAAYSSINDSKGDISREAEALADFYLAMTQASGNVVLLHVVRSLKGLLQENIQCNLDVLQLSPKAAEQIDGSRKKIVEAILNNDPEKARQASNEHLAYIEETLLNINKQDSRMQRALRRIETKG